jgi:hypothetical protein
MDNALSSWAAVQASGLATAQAAVREGVGNASSRKDVQAALVTLPTSEAHVLTCRQTRPGRYSSGSAVLIIWSHSRRTLQLGNLATIDQTRRAASALRQAYCAAKYGSSSISAGVDRIHQALPAAPAWAGPLARFALHVGPSARRRRTRTRSRQHRLARCGENPLWANMAEADRAL